MRYTVMFDVDNIVSCIINTVANGVSGAVPAHSVFTVSDIIDVNLSLLLINLALSYMD